MNIVPFLSTHIATFANHIEQTTAIIPELREISEKIMVASSLGKKVVLVGNGGSAAIASHVSVDFVKVANVRAINFNEADLLTCFSNDFGYEMAFAKAIEFYLDEGDVMVAVSSSGQSENIVNACKAAREQGASWIVTLTGMDRHNRVRGLGDSNLWLEEEKYNHIENTHQFWLLTIVDLIEMQRKGS